MHDWKAMQKAKHDQNAAERREQLPFTDADYERMRQIYDELRAMRDRLEVPVPNEPGMVRYVDMAAYNQLHRTASELGSLLYSVER